MRRVLYALILVAIAFAGIGFVSASHIADNCSDSSIVHQDSIKGPDIFLEGHSLEDTQKMLEWGRRGPRGDAILGSALGGGEGDSFF